MAAGESVLVGPDNGLLSWAVAALGGATAACQLTNDELWLHPVSPTFHGRDIFTPVAAHLASGGDLAAAGTPIDLADLVTLPAPTSRVHDGEAEGEVMSVDRFGNVQLSIASADADRLGLGFGVPGRGPLRTAPADRAVPGDICRGSSRGNCRLHRQRGSHLTRRERRRRGAARAPARGPCPALCGHACLSPPRPAGPAARRRPRAGGRGRAAAPGMGRPPAPPSPPSRTWQNARGTMGGSAHGAAAPEPATAAVAAGLAVTCIGVAAAPAFAADCP